MRGFRLLRSDNRRYVALKHTTGLKILDCCTIALSLKFFPILLASSLGLDVGVVVREKPKGVVT